MVFHAIFLILKFVLLVFLQILLDEGADINMTNLEEQSPLHLGAMNGKQK